MDLSFLQVPAWLTSLAIVSLALVRGALWIRQARFEGHANGKSNGEVPASWQVSIAAALTNLTNAVTQLAKDGDGHTEQLKIVMHDLTSIRRVLDRLEVKQDTLLCREDAVDLAEKNRHTSRDLFQVVTAKLDTLLAREGR